RSAAAKRSIFVRVSGSVGIIELQLAIGIVELPENHDAMENSNAQRWLKSVLTPTISTRENEGCGADFCHAPVTEALPAHPESHATLRISSVNSTEANFTCTRRRPVLRILISQMNIADPTPG